MSSKRFKKLPTDTKKIKADMIEKLLPQIKKNCTTKFDESIDLSFQINNKQKKNEINLRTVINMPGGTGKKVKVAVICVDSKSKEAKDASADIVGGDDFIEKIKNGDLNFDKLICTPSMMIKLSKLGKILGKDNKKVLFGAADTFRAAAVNQLESWSKKINAQIIKSDEGTDPASVAYKSLDFAKKNELLFICANPDFDTVQSYNKNLVFCMGTIAELYQNSGGDTFFLGKA